MIRLKSIKIHRAEGYHDECGPLPVFRTFREADIAMLKAAETAPKTGGYDKCDYTIEWADGRTYGGRYDMKHPEAFGFEYFSTYFHNALAYYAGFGLPSHITLAAYKKMLADEYYKEHTEYCKGLLETAECIPGDTGYKFRLLRDREERKEIA